MHTNQRWGKIKFTGLVKHVVLCRSCSSSSTLNCFLRQGTLRDYCIDQFSSVTPTASRCGVSLMASDPVLRPCQGGGGGGVPMLSVWILKRLVSVFINVCHLLSVLPSLSQFGRGRLSLVAISFYSLLLLFGPCCLSEFTLAGPPSLTTLSFRGLIEGYCW